MGQPVRQVRALRLSGVHIGLILRQRGAGEREGREGGDENSFHDGLHQGLPS